MKITIITPTNNSQNDINECVQSIINQTYKNFEHIIVDNLSTDNTLKKVEEIYSSKNMMSNLRIISEKDDGISDAFKKGIRINMLSIPSLISMLFYFLALILVMKYFVKAFSDKTG